MARPSFYHIVPLLCFLAVMTSASSNQTADLTTTETAASNLTADITTTETAASNQTADLTTTETAASNQTADLTTTETAASNLTADITTTEKAASNQTADITTTERVASNQTADMTTTKPAASNQTAEIATTEATASTAASNQTAVIATTEAAPVTTTAPPPPSRCPILKPGSEIKMSALTIKMREVTFYRELLNTTSEMFKTLAEEVKTFLLDTNHGNGGLNSTGSLRRCDITNFRNGSVIAVFDLVYDALSELSKPNATRGFRDRLAETIQSMGNKTFKTSITGTPNDLTIDSMYLQETTLKQISNVSMCNNRGNFVRCDYGHRCYEHNGDLACFSLCAQTPYGKWRQGDCENGKCSLDGNLTTAIPVCKCNDGFYLQGGECKSYVQIVAIVGGSLGGAVLILIIILIVCTAKKRSPPVPKTIPAELYDIDKVDDSKLKPSIKMEGHPLSEPPKREMSDPQIREGPNGFSEELRRDDRYKDERYKDERNRDERYRDERNRDERYMDERNRDERYRDDPRNQGPTRSNDPKVWPVFSSQQDESNLERRIVSDPDRMPPKRTESWLKQGDQPVRPLSPEEEARFDLAREGDRRTMRDDRDIGVARYPADNYGREEAKPDRSFYDDYKSPNKRDDDPDRRLYERERAERNLYDNRRPYEREISRGYDNRAYSNNEYTKDSREDGQSDFFPRLDGIDTNKDYSIKRPTFTSSVGRL
ncbi:unnamed protein product [Owenia fusiformis]|uniref:Uncharacterized protein n=1 Tax=Owenia fusiformis TaxID=6347 RepID=A0A8J1YAG2_OWEFU|nr:unnamed protein product [Owenia fusiformis]